MSENPLEFHEHAEHAEHAEQPEAEPPPAGEPDEDRHIVEQLQDLIATFKDYIEEAEHNIAEHPAASVVGALLVGILIGRYIGKR